MDKNELDPLGPAREVTLSDPVTGTYATEKGLKEFRDGVDAILAGANPEAGLGTKPRSQ